MSGGGDSLSRAIVVAEDSDDEIEVLGSIGVFGEDHVGSDTETVLDIPSTPPAFEEDVQITQMQRMMNTSFDFSSNV